LELIERFKRSARERGLRVVMPEGTDGRIVAAARLIADDGFAAPVVVGAADKVTAAAAEAGVSLDGIETVDPAEGDRLDGFASVYSGARAGEISEKVARRLCKKRLMFGAMMLRQGEGDVMVAGADSTTANVIQSATLGVGLAEGISAPSSFFLMVLPEFEGERDKLFIFADCAVLVDPDARQLAAIAVASARSAAALLEEEPRLAMISFSTMGSADHELVDKVKEATRLAREALGDGVLLDGEMQADAAIAERVAKKKAPESPVAGRANVLVFPGLESGNACYKLVQYMAGAKALGPVLQGFAKPVSDLSRGATAEDIVGTAAVLCAMASE